MNRYGNKPKEMKQQGFVIDETCYPWVAYKGERFATTETYFCLTDLETEMLEALVYVNERDYKTLSASSWSIIREAIRRAESKQ